MSYMMMILEPRGQRRARSLEEGQAAWDSMVAFGADLKARGLLLAGESLRPDEGGTRLQVRSGKSTLIDGPFAEAKEMVGGFFLLACETKEQALAIAQQCPAARWATIEVRETGPCFIS